MPFNNIKECGIYSSNELPFMTYTHRSSLSSSTYQATYISSQSQKHLSSFPIALDPDIANFICFSFQIFFSFSFTGPNSVGSCLQQDKKQLWVRLYNKIYQHWVRLRAGLGPPPSKTHQRCVLPPTESKIALGQPDPCLLGLDIANLICFSIQIFFSLF